MIFEITYYTIFMKTPNGYKGVYLDSGSDTKTYLMDTCIGASQWIYSTVSSAYDYAHTCT